MARRIVGQEEISVKLLERRLAGAEFSAVTDLADLIKKLISVVGGENDIARSILNIRVMFAEAEVFRIALLDANFMGIIMGARFSAGFEMPEALIPPLRLSIASGAYEDMSLPDVVRAETASELIASLVNVVFDPPEFDRKEDSLIPESFDKN